MYFSSKLTHVMYFIVITKGMAEVVYDVLSQNSIELLWTDHVSEDPPGNGDLPHDDEGHGDDVVEQVAAELTATAGHMMTSLADVTGAFVDSDPQDQQDSDTQASGDQEPRHVGLRWTVGVGFSVWRCLWRVWRLLMIILI